MRPITEEVLEEYFDPGQFTKERDKWRVVTDYGRVFEFDDKGFDLSQCLTPLVPGETEENREEMTFAACVFCQEVWGCVDVRRVNFGQRWKIAGYARAYKFTVDDNAFREFGISDAVASFGETATVKNSWFPLGWRITVPEVGFVVVGRSGKQLAVRSVEGNLYEQTLRFLEKMQGHAVVRGKQAFCATWVTHGEMLSIRVIPEVPRTLLSFLLFSHVTTIVWIVVALLVGDIFPGVTLWISIGIGYVAAAIVLRIWSGDDRKRGDALLNKFPQTGSRSAKLDEARARGMIDADNGHLTNPF